MSSLTIEDLVLQSFDELYFQRLIKLSNVKLSDLLGKKIFISFVPLMVLRLQKSLGRCWKNMYHHLMKVYLVTPSSNRYQ